MDTVLEEPILIDKMWVLIKEKLFLVLKIIFCLLNPKKNN